MESPTLASLTADQYARLATADAVRFLCLAALPNSSPTKAAAQFLDRAPRSVHASLMRKMLDGELLEKAVAPATTTSLPYAGSLMPPALLDPLTRQLQQASLLQRIAGIVQAPPDVPIPYESLAPSLQWVAQNSSKPVSSLTLGSVTLGLYKFAGILALTRELVTCTHGAAITVITNKIVNASTRFLDQQLLDPAVAAVAGKNPASLTNGVTPVAAGATDDATIAALLSAFNAQRPAAQLPTFVMSPNSASRLATGTNLGLDRASGKTLHGNPVVETIDAGAKVILLDASGVYAYDGGAAVDTSEYASVEMEATPASPATAATVMVSLWQANLIGVRLDRFCSWQKEPTAVAFTTLA